jgi:hypothetical protein
MGTEAMTDPEDLDTTTLLLLLAGKLRERVLTHPSLTLGGAAVVGYMIGWSMPTPVYRTVASLAVRTLAMRVVASTLASLQGFDGDQEGSDEDEDDEDLDPHDEGDDLGVEDRDGRPTRSSRPSGSRSSSPPYVT